MFKQKSNSHIVSSLRHSSLDALLTLADEITLAHGRLMDSINRAWPAGAIRSVSPVSVNPRKPLPAMPEFFGPVQEEMSLSEIIHKYGDVIGPEGVSQLRKINDGPPDDEEWKICVEKIKQADRDRKNGIDRY